MNITENMINFVETEKIDNSIVDFYCTDYSYRDERTDYVLILDKSKRDISNFGIWEYS